jgi:hypothetical protein
MSTVSDAIKTSILFGLAIMFLHILAKTRLESAASSLRPPVQSPVRKYADDTETVWEDMADNRNQTAEPIIAAAAAAAASEAADVLDYVFGPVNLAASVAPPVAHPAAAAVSTGKKNDKKNEESATSGLHLVIGSYDNESAMCGGRIFEGVDALQGFDDGGNSFASV